VKAVDAWDWESDNNFKFKVLEDQHDEECNEWNAESTSNLKEVVVSAREQFKWQTAGADDTFRLQSFEEWLEPRNFAPGHCTGKSAVMPTLPSKRGMSNTTTKHVSECTDEKLVSSLKRACAGVETARRPCRYSEHRPNVSRAYILRKCLVRAISPRSRWGGHTSENRGMETHAYMQIQYILPNESRQRVSRSTILSKSVKSLRDGRNPKLPYKGSSRGGTIELL